MVNLYLEKMTKGFKICVSSKKQKRSYNKQLSLKPKNVIGYVLVDKSSRFKNNYLLLVDFVQLYYWLSNGAKFSKSFLKFIQFLDQFLKQVVLSRN